MLKNRKNSVINMFSSRIIIFLILGMIVFIGRAAFHEFQKMTELRKELAKVEAEIRAIEEKSKRIGEAIENFNKEGFLEGEARKRLNLQKPGEKVVAILPPEETLQSQVQTERSRIKEIWEWLRAKIINNH